MSADIQLAQHLGGRVNHEVHLTPGISYETCVTSDPPTLVEDAP
jgi:hypothetical protein